MTDAAPPNSDRRTVPTADESPADLRAVVEERDDGPDECTIYPPAADDEALVTEWITAEAGSYVALREIR
ncbi:hypothetical protein M0R89_04695 [Halorussus limi]|uniref:DUF7511 domain-containing protein n=1 Tax=Halorussus limi TaxID=2938695 RepID=A0A8U0HWR6_9EURY|nr:hypothetical protein [Halorussus limi]UPV75367.1 hypothetical protein M0R89_04695 [Halorussus limi]